MVSPQTLLALGVALPLVAIGCYVAWLARRVGRLEERVRSRGGDADETGESRAGTRSGPD